MTPSRRCHIVTPVYRDVESFLHLRDDVVAVLGEQRSAPTDPHFYVVDDSGGRDPEIARLRDLEDVTVITPPFNLGHQQAIVIGLRTASERFASDDRVVTMDSDGEDRPADIPRLLAALDECDDPSAVVTARRTRRRTGPAFRLMYIGFVIIFRVLTGRVIRSGNFAAFRGSYARTMLRHPSFDLCYSSTLIALDPETVAVPCARGERYAGQSRMSPLDLVTHAARMMMPFSGRIAVRALVLSAIPVVLTVVALLVTIVLRLTGVIESIALPSALLLFGGVGVGFALVIFLILFSGFVQTSALTMGRIDREIRVDG